MLRRVFKFINDWILIFSIIGGVAGYFIYTSIPVLDFTHEAALQTIKIVQPVLIFGMLFLTFCKINLRKLKLCRYHWWLLLFQLGLYIGIGAVVMFLPRNDLRIILEGAMICFICPTGTAGAVIVKKLGGNPTHITSYTILINLVASIVIPASIPLVHPNPDLPFIRAFLLILGKVFPLLLLPLVTAFLIRRFLPKVHFFIQRYGNLSFFLWVAAVTLATMVTTRYIVHSNVGISTGLWLVLVSFIAATSHFFLGRRIGRPYNDAITSGQTLGQKNTVLAIWLGYTFYTPITSVVGGFYSIWQNLMNSWQIHEHEIQ
ncbi:MAG: transporter [Bacteroides sp.]|nr:hypothetical protein [Ruminococcus flavefaciens]MCM1555605.1 transporter [Bacteroides sp.]